MDEGLADLLHRVVMLLGDATRKRAGHDGRLGYSQLRLLGALEGIQPTTQHRLAQALSVSDPAVSRALRPLEADGLVEVVPDPDHGRRRLVRITSAGEEAFRTEGRPLHDEFKAALIAAGFPYERYLDDTLRLAEILTPE
ncbi:MarR family winged helix-turn-helix transcriptional regulator [Streptomyces sp. NRRL F-5126]|uniref:MarR family winged helix-turn-helix transcriptional regulator n=1 Tax=Streptomyces sp. NRRL F-5126 TaxID=1463857 RepID=UPI0004C8732C|nr:MarR family transcriptional regulator [Streptomyces sp. NRRL F-5126]